MRNSLKKFAALLLAAILLFSLVPAVYAAAEEPDEAPAMEASGTAEEAAEGTLEEPETSQASASGKLGNLNWSISGTKLSITGSGKMDEPGSGYTGDAAAFYPWYAYRDSITELVVGKNVASIGRSAFSGYAALKNAALGSGLQSIGSSAFYSSGISTVEIPAKVTSIAAYAFNSCKSLTEITNGAGLTSIEQVVFANCTALKRLVIPHNVTEIRGMAFAYCTALEELDCGECLEIIGFDSFSHCTALRTISFPKSMQKIGTYAFDEDSAIEDVYYDGTEAEWKEVDVGGTDPNYVTSSANTYLAKAEYHFTWSPDRPVVNQPVNTANGIRVECTAVPGAEKYRFYRSADGYEYSVFAETSSAAVLDTEVVVGEDYYYCADVCVSGVWSAKGYAGWIIRNPFTDVGEDNSFFQPVCWAYNNGIVKGTGNVTFSPYAETTRYQFAVMLYKLAGKPAASGTIPFTDVPKNASYYNAVRWAYNNHIISGTTATTFSPNAKVTRYQIVQMLYKYAGKPAVHASNPFTDVKPGNSYYNAVLWAVENKITSGTSASTFSPNEGCKRYQLVVFLYKFNNLYKILR